MPSRKNPGESPSRVPAGRASERALNAVTQAIRDGVYQAGDRLTESRLTRELGVSRSTLREVFRRLSADGLVRLEPNKGAVVRTLSRRDVTELLAVREVLEGFAAGLAARNAAAPERRARVQSMLERINAVRQDGTGVNYLEDNADFHEAIVDLAGNRTLAQQIRQLQLPHVRSRYFERLHSEEWDRSLAEHQHILLAILDGDAALAEQLMGGHVRRTRKMIESLPEDAFDLDEAGESKLARKTAADRNQADGR